MGFKKCYIPCCTNTSANCDKIFITVPKNKARRSAWLAIIPHKELKSFSSLFCCEDHFDLEKDATNWMFYKTMPTSCIILRDDVVPHKYLEYEEELPPYESQLSDSAKKRRLEFEKTFKKRCRRKVSLDEEPSTSNKDSDEEIIAEVDIYEPEVILGTAAEDQSIVIADDSCRASNDAYSTDQINNENDITVLSSDDEDRNGTKSESVENEINDPKEKCLFNDEFDIIEQDSCITYEGNDIQEQENDTAGQENVKLEENDVLNEENSIIKDEAEIEIENDMIWIENDTVRQENGITEQENDARGQEDYTLNEGSFIIKDEIEIVELDKDMIWHDDDTIGQENGMQNKENGIQNEGIVVQNEEIHIQNNQNGVHNEENGIQNEENEIEIVELDKDMIWNENDTIQEESYSSEEDNFIFGKNRKKIKRSISDLQPTLRLQGRHFPEIEVPRTNTAHSYRMCVVCYKKRDDMGDRVRTQTQYYCRECNVGLCPAPCFKIYHTELNF